MTAADGLNRRPFEKPTDSEDDDELAEDSFIDQINLDIFVTIIRRENKMETTQMEAVVMVVGRETG